MMAEPTKSCVRVLKFESAVRYYIKKFLLLLLFIPIAFCNFIDKYLNWCIIRAVVRWFGLPVSIIIITVLMNGDVKNNTDMVFILVVILSVILTFTLACWVEVPEREKEILKSYQGWNKND
jgi:hypothetical protein